MTATISDEAQLRQWLVDYLVTNIGCNPDEVDLDQSLADLGVGSREAVVLSGELSELLGRPVSPVEFWQHPTINALVGFLTAPESESTPTCSRPGRSGLVDEPDRRHRTGVPFPRRHTVARMHCGSSYLRVARAIGEVRRIGGCRSMTAHRRWPRRLAETTRWGSFLSDVDAFDAEFFEISPREADRDGPPAASAAGGRLGGVGARRNSRQARLRRTQTGVFAGRMCQRVRIPGVHAIWAKSTHGRTPGGALSIIANRLSYFLDLRGPSIAVDTACSSSLVAVHLACQSLRTGDSALAIAAGVNLLLSPAITRSFDQAGAMSPTGRCHAFDAGRGRVRAR